MAQSYLPLRWESTGDQWWYASPIDWAAANGHYDVVRELLHLDANLLINLTSLRRIRRLESVWDDDARFADAAKCRASVARSLFLECETKNGGNSLTRAGYGGWLLYTAASAGDAAFVKELLDRDPLLVFGEGEYGVTDMLYAAAKSGSAGVFRALLDFVIYQRRSTDDSGDGSVFQYEMVSRAVHAAARGGSVEMLQELLQGSGDVSAYRDSRGSTILHAAAGRGQLAVVEYLLSSFDVAAAHDSEGNTALHVAAFRGHLPVVETLVVSFPELVRSVNYSGDTFLHAAVAGFSAPGFRRVDRRLELIRRLLGAGMAPEVEAVVNAQNKDGRTALHMAVVGHAHPELVKLLMAVPSIDLNARDAAGGTPLGLLRQQPRSANSEMLIKHFVSAGGVSWLSRRSIDRSAMATELRMQFASSPGTAFNVSDAEIILYSGACAGGEPGERPSSCSSACKTEITQLSATIVPSAGGGTESGRRSKVNRAAERLKVFVKWPQRKEKKPDTATKDDETARSLVRLSQGAAEPATPLRQRFAKPLPSSTSSRRSLSVRCSTPSSSSATRKKLAAGLMHGVMETMPHLAPPASQPAAPPSPSMKQNGVAAALHETPAASRSGPASPASTAGGTAGKRMRKVRCGSAGGLFCFGAQGLMVEDSITGQRSSWMFKRPSLAAA